MRRFLFNTQITNNRLNLQNGNKQRTFNQRSQILGLGFAFTFYRAILDLQCVYQQAKCLALFGFGHRNRHLHWFRLFDCFGFENNGAQFI